MPATRQRNEHANIALARVGVESLLPLASASCHRDYRPAGVPPFYTDFVNTTYEEPANIDGWIFVHGGQIKVTLYDKNGDPIMFRYRDIQSHWRKP